MTKYILVSQGIKIFETYDKQEAERMTYGANNEWYDCKQECLDSHESYADNEVEMFEEE